jgi:hypothetical protein
MGDVSQEIFARVQLLAEEYRDTLPDVIAHGDKKAAMRLDWLEAEIKKLGYGIALIVDLDNPNGHKIAVVNLNRKAVH